MRLMRPGRISVAAATVGSLGPRNGHELAQSIGSAEDEGVQVALFPCEPTEAALGEEFAYAPGVMAQAVFAELGYWGRRLLDIILLDSNKGVKWWKVREYGKSIKAPFVPVNWQGPIVEIPDKYFVPELGVRFFNAGPWFWPVKGSHLEDNLAVLRGLTGGTDE